MCPSCATHRQPKATRAVWEKELDSPADFELFPDLHTVPLESGAPIKEQLEAPPAYVAGAPSGNVSRRGRVRRERVKYNPVFLALAALENAVSMSDTALVPPDPKTLKEALSTPEAADWMEATVSEVTSLLEKGTFEVVNIPEDKKLVDTKWVFKRKVDAFGNFVKYKTRLVPKGFLEKFGVDYFDVFSPVTKLSTLRVLLSLVAALDLELRHVDV